MKITKNNIRKLIREAMNKEMGDSVNEQARALLGDLLLEGDVIDFPHKPSLPWVFGPEGYTKRPELTQQYEKKQDVGADSPPEAMVARALAYRASELTNYKKEFNDEIFSDYAMRIYQDYVLGKSGDKFQALDSMLNRIDDGGWDDDDIMDIASGGEQYYGLSPGDNTEMSRTKEMASQQSAKGLADMDMDFEKYMQGIESGKVVDIDEEL
jgi:hypothetical protein|tara:strand:+ start:116 stop:748 length:633 start_codon:yes stop_codon:yes gene_type:complete